MAGLEGDEKLIKWLNELRDHAIEVNARRADQRWALTQSAVMRGQAIGHREPVVDTASGIHPRFSDYYVRTVRQDDNDPLTDSS